MHPGDEFSRTIPLSAAKVQVGHLISGHVFHGKAAERRFILTFLTVESSCVDENNHLPYLCVLLKATFKELNMQMSFDCLLVVDFFCDIHQLSIACLDTRSK